MLSKPIIKPKNKLTSLSCNKLSTLEGLEQFNNLCSLNLSNNKITHLSDELFNLTQLGVLFAGKNPVTSPPIEQLKLKDEIIVNLFYIRNKRV